MRRQQRGVWLVPERGDHIAARQRQKSLTRILPPEKRAHLARRAQAQGACSLAGKGFGYQFARLHQRQHHHVIAFGAARAGTHLVG